MRRRDLLSLAATPLLACGPKRSRDSIRVLAYPFLYNAPLYLAQEQGYFAREGLEVEINSLGGSLNAMPLLAGGKADAALYSINPSFVNAVYRGANVRLAAARLSMSPECRGDLRMLGSKAAFPDGFHDFSQLRGRRVGVRHLTSISTFQLDACLEKASLTRDDIEIVMMEDNVGSAMLKAGTVDVLVSANEEFHLTRLRESVVLGPSLAEALPGFVTSYMMFGARLLDGPIDPGVRFLRAFLRGSRDFAAGRNPQFLFDFVRSNGMREDTPARLCRDRVVQEGRVPLADVQRFSEWTFQKGICPVSQPAADLVDMRFIDHL